MGSFIGHILPGTLFLLVGVWHIWSSVVRYVSNPKTFRVCVWNPVPGFDGKFKHLELYVISIGAFIDLCVELLIATQLKFFVGGILNSTYLNNFEHSGMLVMFLIFEGALCLIAGTAFAAEYLLFNFHSTTHKGLEGYYHVLLAFLVGLCVLSSIAGALLPTSFPVDLCKGIGITLQGIWFYQTAFVLYGPMLPAGCSMKDNVITCHSKESVVRGELFANVQLFFAVLAVHVGTIASFGFAASRYGNFEELASN
ncbi:hypothetical protein TSUD_154880 [Trifolium subterraneum]|uniref:Transmembrane protein 45B n=1 Tax=Trifolium subterraneum TaxID=3900 RepID=A0A2Z6LYE4_TRISU|nr:hypothetical protein TSUD_154880 [Trifolium subterraneum]